jgi:SAM-dependent methyltransferase
VRQGNVPASKGPSRGLPEEFAPADKRASLYEDVEYEEYWDGPAQVRQDALEKHLISEMLPARGRRIIDLGCGYGRLAPCYIDRFDQVVLFDGSMSLLRQAHDSVGDRAILVAGDVGRLPFKKASFDSALSIRVLQHMHDLEGAVKGMRRILARDGQLVFSYHNKRNAHRILHYLNSRKIGDPFSPESVEVSPTLLSHHPTTMASVLRAASFSEPEYRGAVVVNSLASATEKLGGRAPSGLLWAPLMGRFKLAPWLVGRTTAQGGGGFSPGGSIDDLFQCPVCEGNVSRSDQAFVCRGCQREYPISEGIADFRP